MKSRLLEMHNVFKSSVPLAGMMSVAIAASAAGSEAPTLTWAGTGSAKWGDQGKWKTASNATATWSDWSIAKFTSPDASATVPIAGSAKAFGLVFSDYSRQLGVTGDTLALANGATMLKEGDCGVKVSSAIPMPTRRRDEPNASDTRFATCASGERAWTAGAHGGLPNKNTGGQWDAYTGTNVVYWRNRKLSGIVGFVSADFYRRTGPKCLGAKPYHYVNNGSTASVQFQYRDSDTANYGAKVVFTQQGKDILARIEYWRARDLPDGADFSTEGSGGAQTIWDERTGAGNWTVCNIVAEEALGTLTVVSNDEATSPKYVSPTLLRSSKSDSSCGTNTLLWAGRRLSDLEFKCATFVWVYGARYRARPYNRKIEDDGRTSVQFRAQLSSSVLCIKVLFQQKGNDIYAQIANVGAKAVDIERDWDDPDVQFTHGVLPIYDGVVANKGNAWGICEIGAAHKTVGPLEFSGLTTLPERLNVSNGVFKISSGADFAFSKSVFKGDGTVHFAGGRLTQTGAATNALTGGLVLDGTKCLVNAVPGARICGSGAEIRLINGGELVTTNGAREAIGTSNVKMYIGPGSKFVQNNSCNFNLRSVALTVDGGRCELRNSATYIQNLTVKNGAQVVEVGGTGSYWFGRDSMTPVITSEGDGEVTIASRMRLFKNENKEWTGAKQYLTVNTKADLRLTGGIMMAVEYKYNGMRIRKKGPAKLIYDYSPTDFPSTEQAFTIEQCVDEGTLELAKSNAIVASEPVSLYGHGTLLAGNGTVNSGGVLTVGGTNTIEIAGSGKLSFETVNIADGAKLNVTGVTGMNVFRIGDGRCLSEQQLSRIHVNGCKSYQNADGYLGAAGMMIRLE